MKNILILCTGNSCRSQMAEGYLRLFLNNQNVNIYSAGTDVQVVNEHAIKTMSEDGVDISTHTSNHIDEYCHVDFDYVITVCNRAKEHCPILFTRQAKHIHQPFDDPAVFTTSNDIALIFARVRVEIRDFCTHFVKTYF